MELSLGDAARLLGKNRRQVRYLIQAGSLPAKKTGGRWSVKREDLPLSEGQLRAREHKLDQATRIAQEVLGTPSGNGEKPPYSVRDLKAFERGRALLAKLADAKPAEDPARALLRESLTLLVCGCHAFSKQEKRHYFGQAREQASRAVAALLLDEKGEDNLALEIEAELLPAIGGLIRRTESKTPR